MKLPRWIRRIALALALVIIALLALYAFLQTSPGRALVAALIENAASSDGRRVKIEGLDGAIPGAPHIAKVTISDATGAWLTLSGVTADWSPLALIGGSVVVNDLTVKRIDWQRSPATSAEASTSSGGSGGAAPIAVHKLNVETLTIAPEVAGVPATFTINGSIDLLDPANRVILKLAVSERRGARAEIDTNYDTAKNLLDLNATIKDEAGGTLAAMLGLDPNAPLSVDVKSDGPLDRWRATLTATGGDALGATGEATILRRNEWRDLKLSLVSNVGAIGPARLRPLYEGVASIDIAAARSDDGAIRIDRLTAMTPAIAAEASGVFDPTAKRAEGRATLKAPQGAALAPLIGDADWRDLVATAKLQGPWPTPILIVDANAAAVAAQGVSVSTLAAHLEALPDRQWDDPDARIGVTSRIDAEGLQSANATLSKALGPTATLTLQGALLDRTRLTDAAGELKTAGAVLRFAGAASASAVQGVLSLEAPDLALGGFKGGALSLRTTVAANLDAGTLNAEGKGVAQDLALGSDVDGLFAGKQDLAFALTGSSNDLRLASLTLEGEHLSMIASGVIGKEALDVESRITVADIAAISPEHAGRAEVNVHLMGAPDAPRASATAHLASGKIFGRPAQSLALTLSRPDGQDIGRIALSGDYDGKPLEGAASVAWQPKGGARVDGLRAKFASVALTGDAAVTPNGLIDGRTQLDIADLADIGPYIDEDIAGPLKGEIRFEPAGGKQTATLALNAARFRIDDNTFAGLATTGAITDAFGDAAFTLRARTATADLDGFPLQNLDASGTGPLRAMAIAARAQHKATTIDAKGVLKVAGKPTIIVVDTLQLARADKTARLAAPIEIAIGDHRVLIPPSRIAAGGGEATLSGDAGRATDLKVAATALPLWVADFVSDEPLPLTGALTGAAQIGKHGATTFDVKVANLAPTAEPGLIRNLTATATGKTDRTGVDLKLTLADAGRTSFRANGRLPLSETGALAIEAEGAADLALANAYLGVTGDRARGALTVSARINGTRAAPRIQGTAKIANGFFRSAESGFELRDIEAALAGSERSVTVISLTATAPNGGDISGRGDIRLEPAANYPLTLSVTARKAQLVSTELTTVVANVDARMSGSLADAQVSGTADIDRWDIRLPEKLARPLNPIRVTHRNAPTDLAANMPAAEEAESALKLDLDVTVRAQRRVFVRGQGVDAEFGGNVKVTGTVDDPKANGRFELRRGAVTMLSQRIALTRGDIAFAGDVVPTLDIAGEVRKSDLTATVAVKGKANAPEVTLSSTPTLPQDEIIARLLFNKSVQQLSAFEAAQLAASIARMSGLTSGPDILERLRSALGIDALGAVTDSAGGTAVSAGSYVGSGVYVGLVQGADATAGRATVDIDLNERVKLRGEVAPTGDTKVGVVAEWEY